MYNEITKFFNIINELDYSVKNYSKLDSRVLQICKDAEIDYLKNKETTEEIKRLKSSQQFTSRSMQPKKITKNAIEIQDNLSKAGRKSKEFLASSKQIKKSESDLLRNEEYFNPNLKIPHRHLKSGSKCMACDLKRR